MRWRFGLWKREIVGVVGVVDKVLGELGYGVKLSLFEVPSEVSTGTKEEDDRHTV